MKLKHKYFRRISLKKYLKNDASYKYNDFLLHLSLIPLVIDSKWHFKNSS